MKQSDNDHLTASNLAGESTNVTGGYSAVKLATQVPG